MEEVRAYKTTDGRLFAHKEQADDHEFALEWLKQVEEFHSSPLCPYTSGTQYGMIGKIIVAWEKFKAGRL